MFVDKLKNLNFNVADLDELVFFLALAESARAKFDGLAVEVPVWLDNQIRGLKNEIKSQNRTH
jgi:hypothetical protein